MMESEYFHCRGHGTSAFSHSPWRGGRKVDDRLAASVPTRSIGLSDVQVHPNRLRLGEIINRGRAMFSAEAGIAHSAPRQPHIGIAIGVDPDGASVCLLHETLHAPNVAAPHPSREAVGSTIGDAQRIGLITKLAD